MCQRAKISHVCRPLVSQKKMWAVDGQGAKMCLPIKNEEDGRPKKKRWGNAHLFNLIFGAHLSPIPIPQSITSKRTRRRNRECYKNHAVNDRGTDSKSTGDSITETT